jgi:hypothetical protein
VINRSFSLGIGDSLRIPQTVRACPVPLYSSARFTSVRVSQRKLIEPRTHLLAVRIPAGTPPADGQR